MSRLTRASYENKYNNVSTGLYRAGQSAGIGSDDHRALVTDTQESALWYDDLPDFFARVACNESSANEYEIIYGPTIIDYEQHEIFVAVFDAENSGAVTLFYDDGTTSLSPLPLLKQTSTGREDLESGEIQEGGFYLIAFDRVEDEFVVVGSIGGGSSTEEAESTTTISSASVLTGNATPVDLVAAPGSGKVNIPLSFILSMDYNSAAYATNVEIQLQYADGTGIIIDSDFITATADKVRLYTVPTVDGVINSKIQFKVNTGNPTAGNSPIKIVTKYKTITI